MVEEIIKGAFELNESDLGRLDRLADKARKVIEKARKVTGGVTGKGETPFAQFFDRVEKERKKGEGRRNKKDKGKQLDTILESKLGTDKAGQALSFFGNPTGFMANMLTRQLPILGGILAAKDIAEFIVGELIKKGRLLDRTFREIINDRLDALRNKELQQEIVSGFTQIIITSESGEQNIRNSYNSFEVSNRDQEALEDDFKVRNTRGLD